MVRYKERAGRDLIAANAPLSNDLRPVGSFLHDEKHPDSNPVVSSLAETRGCLDSLTDKKRAISGRGWDKLRCWCGVSGLAMQSLAKDFCLQELEYGILYEQ